MNIWCFAQFRYERFEIQTVFFIIWSVHFVQWIIMSKFQIFFSRSLVHWQNEHWTVVIPYLVMRRLIDIKIDCIEIQRILKYPIPCVIIRIWHWSFCVIPNQEESNRARFFLIRTLHIPQEAQNRAIVKLLNVRSRLTRIWSAWTLKKQKTSIKIEQK